MLEGVLKKIGYRVTVAMRSSNALALVERSPLAFDLVILDQTMPEMAGDELAQRMLAIRPDLPIILCSGFSKKLTPQRLREIGIKKLLSKPCPEAELQREVRLILDAAKK
jgi:CheY-like chemotaxis protein